MFILARLIILGIFWPISIFVLIIGIFICEDGKDYGDYIKWILTGKTK